MSWGPESLGLLLFALLVFPGLFFTVALALFSEWYLRKIVARMQNRMGPSYVGPFGILQPLADFLKLVMSKEEVVQKFSLSWVPKAMALTGIGAAVASLLFLPISPFRVVAPYDFVVYLYICSLWVPVSIVFMGLSAPNPFVSAGISRLLSLFIATEPVWFAAVLVPVALTTYYGYSEMPFSVFCTAVNSWRLWSEPLGAVAMLLGLVGTVVSIQAKEMAQPFNIPEAEHELIAGFATEFSGPVLGLFNLVHDVDTAVSLLLVTYIYLGGPYPYPHLSVPGILLLIVKYLALLTVVSVIRSSFGRFRIEQGIETLLKYSAAPVAIALILANIAPIIT